jgi:hypothetical protein
VANCSTSSSATDVLATRVLRSVNRPQRYLGAALLQLRGDQRRRFTQGPHRCQGGGPDPFGSGQCPDFFDGVHHPRHEFPVHAEHLTGQNDLPPGTARSRRRPTSRGRRSPMGLGTFGQRDPHRNPTESGVVAWLDITAVRVDRDGPVRLAFSTRSYCGSPSDLDVVSLRLHGAGLRVGVGVAAAGTTRRRRAGTPEQQHQLDPHPAGAGSGPGAESAHLMR